MEPVSQIHLSLSGCGEAGAFEAARNEILKFAVERAGGPLPRDALDGKSFSTDDVGAGLALAEAEIEQLKNDPASQKQESGALLEVAEAEREGAEADVRRLQGMLHHLQQRLQSLETAGGQAADTPIPNDLAELEQWAATHLAGSVDLHNRALRGAKNSEYVDVSVIYQALLLLRDYDVPMRRGDGPELRQAYDKRCQELGIKKQQSFAGNRAGEQGDTYFVRIGNFVRIGKRRIELERHLKKGNNREARYCFRLCFCLDDTTRQVVVGWLPSHLSMRAS